MTTFPSLTWPEPNSNTPREPARREPGRSAEVYGPQKRKPDTSAPPADEINTRQGQTPADGLRALVRAWGRILDPSAWISVGEEPDTRASRLIRWASLLAPVVIASVPLAIALFVASRARVPWALVSSDAMVPTLLTIYAVGCVLMAVALYTAPNGVVWALALLLSRWR